MGPITMLLFQPDSHAATAVSPNPSVMLEMGSLPGITLGSMTLSPACWGTQQLIVPYPSDS